MGAGFFVPKNGECSPRESVHCGPPLTVGVAMTSDVCAKKLRNGMGGNPHGFCQGDREPLGLRKTGRSVLVSSMPLKGTGELEANQQEARLG